MYHARRRLEGTDGLCFPDYLYYSSLLFGGFFNCLNFYCAYKYNVDSLKECVMFFLLNKLTHLSPGFLKLIKKINRKLKGNESLEMKDKLDD